MRDLDAAIGQYVLSLEAEGRSPATTSWHREALSGLGVWLRASGHPESPTRWTPVLLREWIRHLQTRPNKHTGAPLSASYVNNQVRSLRAFCRWLLREELVDRDPFDRVRVPKTPKMVKPTLGPEEVRLLLGAAVDGRNGARDEAIVLFMLDTAARANEVVTLRAEDIDWRRGVAKVWGKGAKEREVPFSAVTGKAMQRYLLRRRNPDCETFFQTEEGSPLTYDGLYQITCRISRKTGVPVNPHKLRHTAALQYLRNGGNAFALQKLLGHTTLHTTLNYVAMNSDDLVAEHRQHSPLGGLLGKGRR